MESDNLNNEQLPIRYYVWWLSVLSLIFLFRVLAQLIQLLSPLSYLPPFSAWQSGALAYHWLLISQIIILIILGWTIRALHTATLRPDKKWGKRLTTLGQVYLGIMLARLTLGLTLLATHPWFGARIPTFFHLVLACIVLLIGDFHRRFS